MKTPAPFFPIRIAGFVACAGLILTGLLENRPALFAASPESSQPSTATKESSRNDPSAQNAANAARDAVGDAWEKSKDAPFKQREAVRERMKAAEAALDAKILEWTAKKDSVAEDAKPAVAAAHKEVVEAREVLSQKVNGLDNATEETWNSVKAELNTAWQRMTSAASDLAAKLQS